MIENKYPPIIAIDKKIYGELPYCCTKKFVEYFDTMNKVDFILFIGYLGGKPQVIYIDHKSMNAMKNVVDISNRSVEIINFNEITMCGSFSIKAD